MPFRPSRAWLPACLAVVGVSVVAAGPVQEAQEFAALVREYRSGNPQRAVEVIAGWKDREIDTRYVAPSATAPLAEQAAAALLLTEAGMASRRFGRFREERPGELNLGYYGLTRTFEGHAFESYRLIETLTTRAKSANDAELMAWIKSWYILASSYCREFAIHCGQSLYERGREVLDKGDPEVMVWRGSMEEPTDKSRWRMRHEVYDPTVGQEARYWFRKALEVKPSLVEARARLARSLHITLNEPEAEPLAVQALDDARTQRHVFAGYLAALTLGEIVEARGDLQGAAEHYQAAVAFVPGHTAHIARGQALIRSGRRAEGWELGRQMFGTRGDGLESVLDPFSIYTSAQYWQSASRVTEMRKAIRVDGR